MLDFGEGIDDFGDVGLYIVGTEQGRSSDDEEEEDDEDEEDAEEASIGVR